MRAGRELNEYSPCSHEESIFNLMLVGTQRSWSPGRRCSHIWIRWCRLRKQPWTSDLSVWGKAEDATCGPHVMKECKGTGKGKKGGGDKGKGGEDHGKKGKFKG